MSSFDTMTSAEIEQSGYEYGAELAAALVLASSRPDADIRMKREMAQIVLREIDSAVDTLRDGMAPLLLVACYEQACRAGVRDELARRVGSAADHPSRHAA
jgi:predicted HAD superfamily phosphohydrolase